MPSSMPINLAGHYEGEFKALLDSINGGINSVENPSLVSAAGLEETRQNLNEDLASARDTLSRLEMEIHMRPSNEQGELQSRLRQHHQKLSLVYRRYEQLINGEAPISVGDLSSHLQNKNDSELDDDDDGSHEYLLGTRANSPRIKDATARLTDSHRVALETEQIGVTVLDDLRRQREQIQHAHTTLHQTEGQLDRSNRVLREMIKRMATNRFISAGIVGLLLLSILLVIYIKLH